MYMLCYCDVTLDCITINSYHVFRQAESFAFFHCTRVLRRTFLPASPCRRVSNYDFLKKTFHRLPLVIVASGAVI